MKKLLFGLVLALLLVGCDWDRNRYANDGVDENKASIQVIDSFLEAQHTFLEDEFADANSEITRLNAELDTLNQSLADTYDPWPVWNRLDALEAATPEDEMVADLREELRLSDQQLSATTATLKLHVKDHTKIPRAAATAARGLELWWSPGWVDDWEVAQNAFVTYALGMGDATLNEYVTEWIAGIRSSEAITIQLEYLFWREIQ